MITKVLSQKSLPKQAADLLTAISGHGFIAGGYARDIILGTHTSTDIDIFCYKDDAIYPEPIDTDVFEWQGDIINSIKGLGYEYKRQLPNALEFLLPCKDGKHNRNFRKVQLIIPFKNEWMQTYGRVDEVIGQFDFTVVMAALDAFTSSRVTADGVEYTSCFYTFEDEDFRKDSKKKRLYIRHINCPIAVAMRVNKYSAKGFFIGPKEIIKLFKEWNNRPESYRKRLERFADSNDSLDPKEWWEIEKLLRID